ncbi:ATP-binding protein [Alkalicoccus luteus]|uniref:histidine kinase n=1 Tax=Alkalicoccus luteus TaxID=1237094 RepID=A0A969TVQ6_9BACI|nr:ATP-binding protein [Alkalicoccus luteus]NJP38256.1 response regulator [Alkalicoccus luteus]
MKNRSIRASYIRKSALFIAAVLVVTAAVTGYLMYDQNQSEEAQKQLSERYEAVDAVSERLNELFFHSRSYYAYQNEDDLRSAQLDLRALSVGLDRMEELELSEEERRFALELRSFLIDYETDILPTAAALVAADDYEGLRSFGQEGSVAQINGLFDQASELRNTVFADLQQEYESALDESTTNLLLSFAFGMLVFFAILFMSQRLLRQLIVPVEELTEASDKLAEGETIDIEAASRHDELGVLGRSFMNMASSLQQNEEEMQAQNEELKAQQDSLQDLLEEADKEKRKVDRFSLLNETMSTRLDRQELLDAVFAYVNELYPSDRSMFCMMDTLDFRAANMTGTMIESWQQADKTMWVQRLTDDKRVIITRPAEESDKGIAPAAEITDYYTAVKDAEGHIYAIFAATNIGSRFSEEEMEEIEALMSHVGIGLQRVLIHEEIAKSRKLSQKILDTVNEGIQLIGHDGTCLQENRAAAELIQGEWPESLLQIVDEPEELEKFIEGMISQESAGSASHEFTMQHGESSVVYSVYSTPVFDENQRIGTIFVYRDRTRESELDRMKSELVSTVSHELRTPLSSVLGFTELLLKKELKPERQKKYITTIHKEAKRLTNLINDFLDLQRMESGSQPYRMENVQLDQLVLETIYQFRHVATHELLFEDTAGGAAVQADGERMQQVLTNLISNAVKFSPAGGKVKVTLAAKDDTLQLSVSDEGLGIPESEKARLFQKFQRIDQSDRRNIGGTGLGLAICREIVEKHGGRISVESEEGKGSVFNVELPLRESGQAVDGREQAANGETVFIVEDDASLALLLSEELKTNGYRVVHYMHVDSALSAMKENPPSAAVIDLMLGEGGNGWDLVQRMKQDPATKDIPIVISSALDEAEEKTEEFGITRYLTKPYPPERLSRAVMEHAGGNGDILFPEQNPPS